ncbi:UbiA family prenyltransferase [Streptomyces sp. NPDC126510]|uniref:UbiA family prenyltransferase n=1 Tax=Streptomyces sp. NPDC126510 TaxID=3155317 RepID=UPI003323368F
MPTATRFDLHRTDLPEISNVSDKHGVFPRGPRLAGFCLQEARVSVQVIFLVRFVFAGTAGVTLWDVSTRLLPGAVLWFLAVTAVYLYNGTTDVREDRANGSGRPIARGALSVRSARRSAAVLSASALVGGLLMAPPVGAAIGALLLLGYAYSTPGISLKRHTPGTALTVMASGALTYATGVLCGRATVSPALIAFCAAMCLWMGLAELAIAVPRLRRTRGTAARRAVVQT